MMVEGDGYIHVDFPADVSAPERARLVEMIAEAGVGEGSPASVNTVVVVPEAPKEAAFAAVREATKHWLREAGIPKALVRSDGEEVVVFGNPRDRRRVTVKIPTDIDTTERRDAFADAVKQADGSQVAWERRSGDEKAQTGLFTLPESTEGQAKRLANDLLVHVYGAEAGCGWIVGGCLPE